MKVIVTKPEALAIIKKSLTAMGLVVHEVEIDFNPTPIPTFLTAILSDLRGYAESKVNKLQAIKLLRETCKLGDQHRVGLKEAKDIIDNWYETQNEPDWADFTERFGLQ